MATQAELTARVGRAKIASIADLTDSEDACVVGIVRSEQVLISPDGHACVAYRLRDSAGHDEQRAVTFWVEDKTGRALIDGANAILLVTIHESEGLHRSVVGAKFLRSHGFPGTHFEQRIDVGSSLYVIGACTREPDPTADAGLYRERSASRIRFEHREAMPLLLADTLDMSAFRSV